MPDSGLSSKVEVVFNGERTEVTAVDGMRLTH